jgi:hypothetical protein
MELKVVCQCGQKYKFDVEPVNGQMPFTVNCPLCNADGTGRPNSETRLDPQKKWGDLLSRLAFFIFNGKFAGK